MAAIPELDKREILAALVARLRADLAALATSQQAAQSGATHEETRPEHAKDTRAIEATYLARGLADRTETLRDAIVTLESLEPAPADPAAGAALLALVTLEDDQGERLSYLLVPVGGGERLCVSGKTVLTLTPASPIGRRLLGRREGDEVVIDRPRGTLHATLVALR